MTFAFLNSLWTFDLGHCESFDAGTCMSHGQFSGAKRSPEPNTPISTTCKLRFCSAVDYNWHHLKSTADHVETSNPLWKIGHPSVGLFPHLISVATRRLSFFAKDSGKKNLQ